MRITKYATELNEERTYSLVKEKSVNYDAKKIDTPQAISKMMCDVFRIDKNTEEYIYILATDTSLKPMGVFEISHGTVDASIIKPRDLFIRLLLCNASRFFLIHNHPSGDVTPSYADFQVTKRIKELCDLMGIDLLDHIIIGDCEYYSFQEHSNL